ncbi:MAG: hypothetical protein FRX49_10793 [Trebouxia sp. A1-2]|nr:MAG: hypothetical protein FRX49_10793 [Trebouxia sp. A1-2]
MEAKRILAASQGDVAALEATAKVGQQTSQASQEQAEAAAAKQQQSFQTLTTEQSRLSAELTRLREDLKTSCAQNDTLSAQVGWAKTEQQTLSGQLTQASTALHQREADWIETKAMLEAKVIRLSQEVTRLEHARDAATASEQHLKAELANTRSSANDQQNSLQDEIKQLKAAVQQAADASATTAAEQEQSDTADARASLQQQSVSHTVKRQLEELQAQIQSAQQVSSHAAADDEQLQTQLTQAKEYHVLFKGSSEEIIEDLTEQVKRAMKRSDALAAEKQKSQQDLEGAQSAAALQQHNLQEELQQEHEDALRDLEDQMERAVSKAQAEGEAAVQAKADIDQSGFHRNDEVRHREHELHKKEKQHLESELKKSAAKAERLEQQVKDLSKQVRLAEDGHQQEVRPQQAKRRHTAHAPHRRSVTPKLKPAFPSDAIWPSRSTVPEAAAQQMPQNVSHQQGPAEADESMHEASGPVEGTPVEGSKRQSGSGQKEEPPQSLWGKALGLLAGRKAAKELKAQPSSSESEQKPETSQAESAQGLESAQEDVVAPQPPMTAASTKGRGSGRGQGRGKGQSGVRATACKAAATADDAQGAAAVQPEGSAQQTSVAAPGKRGRSRTSKQPTAAPAAAAALVMQAPAAGTAEANDLHGVASEPAGPVAEQTEAPKKRKRRTASSLSELKQEATAGPRKANEGAGAHAEPAPSRQTRAMTRSRATLASTDMHDTAGTSAVRAGKRRTKAPNTFTLLEPVSEDESHQPKPVKKQKH